MRLLEAALGAPKHNPLLRVTAAAGACVRGLARTGCTRIGTTTVTPEEFAEATRASALSHSRASETTARLLRLALLEDLADEAPERAMRALLAIHEREDRPWASIEGITAVAELAILAGRQIEATAPEKATGFFLAAAELAGDGALQAVRGDFSPLNPQARFAADLYNFSVGRAISLLSGPLAIGTRSPADAILEGPFGTFRIELEGDRRIWDPNAFELRPADQIAVHGLVNRHRSSGLGAPLVACLKVIPERLLPEDGLLPAFKGIYGVTGIVDFEPDHSERDNPATSGNDRHRRARIRFHDPLAGTTFQLNDLTVPLEADFTAPLAVLNEIAEPRASGAAAALRAENYTDEVGLLLFEPYRLNKIPVVLVHGLQSNSVTWIKMVNGLRADPILREQYQVLAFNYPTGLPFTYSGALLRQTLKQAFQQLDPNGDNPRLDRMVIIGHSMGGLVSRLQVTHSQDRLWSALSDRRFDDLEAEARDLELLRSTLFIEPLPWVSRAIFMATPHRGTPLASGALGRLARSLVRAPLELVESFARLLEAEVFPQDLIQEDNLDSPNIFYSLAPDNPLLLALDQLPPQVPFHTIVADLPLVDDEIISDGLVEGASALIEGAASEKTIISTHGVHLHPEGIAEVRRILKLHLETPTSGDGVRGRPPERRPRVSGGVSVQSRVNPREPRARRPRLGAPG